MKNHWNATARRKDAPVQNKDGTSVVLREHLLRTKCGDPNLEVVQVTVGGGERAGHRGEAGGD